MKTALHSAKFWLAAMSVMVLSGCASVGTQTSAQNPNQGYGPVNAVFSQSNESLMLKGHDVVSYFTQSKHAMGSPQIKSVYKGVTFQFANEDHKKRFDASPESYLPQYGGYCSNGIVYGIPWGGDANTWRIDNGKLYIFGGQGSKDAFELDLSANLAHANHYWTTEVSGSDAAAQRSKRAANKVAHYKTDAELKAMVAKAKEAKALAK